MDDPFSSPVAELVPLTVAAAPSQGQGLALDDKGQIPTAAREIRTGTAAERPTASLALATLFWFATDTAVLSYCTGTAWTTVSATMQAGTSTFTSMANVTGYENVVTFATPFASTPTVTVTLKSQSGAGNPPTYQLNTFYARDPSTTQFTLGVWNVVNLTTCVFAWTAVVV
jgi:hypothetical protein